VVDVVSGYAGGTTANPTYDQVSAGVTGHAEAVLVTYDPSQVSYGELLKIFFSVAHDPTQRNRQGPDVGTQYRSAIFFGDAEQEKVARDYIAVIHDRPKVKHLKEQFPQLYRDHTAAAKR
jgi:peptide-methionine (S)-S-oxide reductase